MCVNICFAAKDNNALCQQHLLQPRPWHPRHIFEDITEMIYHNLEANDLSPDK